MVVDDEDGWSTGREASAGVERGCDGGTAGVPLRGALVVDG